MTNMNMTVTNGDTDFRILRKKEKKEIEGGESFTKVKFMYI